MAYLLRFWMRGSYKAEAQRLRRIDLIRGHQLETVNPTIRVFSARARTSVV
jgi:hypothetical protein